MVVATLSQIPPGFLPLEVGPGPFPDRGYTSWWLIRHYSLDLVKECVDKGEGGIKWYGKLKRSFSGPIGVFRY